MQAVRILTWLGSVSLAAGAATVGVVPLAALAQDRASPDGTPLPARALPPAPLPPAASSSEHRKSLAAICVARNRDTAAAIYGSCDAGRFSGADAETGNVVLGRCQADGTIIATDTRTAQPAAGRCRRAD